MVRWSGLALLVLLTPSLARAQDEPERLLSDKTQVYLRWDGVEAHRTHYEKTALGKMLQGDTGKFIDGVFVQLQSSLGSLLTVEQLLGGASPEKLQKLQADAKEAPKLLHLIGQHGFVLGAELRRTMPPQAQLTFIIPNAGAEPGPLFGSLRLAATLSKSEAKESKIAGRTVHQLSDKDSPVHLAWWVEGKHAVVVFGTDPAEEVVKRLTATNEGRLLTNPLFKRVHDFDGFRTAGRGFVDVASLAKLARTAHKDVDKLVTDLGIDGLKSIVFYTGFDGDAERGLVELDMPGPRLGLLKAFTGKPFKFEDVPPLPTDVISWSMFSVNPAAVYDVGTATLENVVRLTSPDEVAALKEGIKQLDTILGVKLREDVLAALDDKMLMYNSPAEGPFTLGQTFLLKVKDAKKLQEALDEAVKNAGKASGADITVKKKKYHGAEIREIHIHEQGMFLLPSYTIYKDWLVVGFFPQAVQGYVLRANNELRSWKPSERVQKTLEKLPKEHVALSYSDPRPSLKQLLSLAPLLGAALDSNTKEYHFDVGGLPNAHEATRHLFPNISVVTDDGKTLRIESRASLELPLDISGLDSYGIFIFGAFAIRGF